MVSPNTLRLQGKDKEGNDLCSVHPTLILPARPNLFKRQQRYIKTMQRGNTRGKQRG